MNSNNSKSNPHPSVITKPNIGPANTEITLIVILAGVLIGLLLVVIILCVCKFCIKSNKPLKRQQVVFTKYSSEKDFTWTENEKRCTKYRSMEPRWSPASSIIPIDFETGSPESSIERKHDDKSVELTTSRSNFLLPGDRVLPQCSIDKNLGQQSTDSKQISIQSTSRTTDEVCAQSSGTRFPRSSTVERHSSIYVTTSDEHLDRIHHQKTIGLESNIKVKGKSDPENSCQRKRPSISMVALASPEEVSSLEEAGTTIILIPPQSQTVVSAEVHQVPHSKKSVLFSSFLSTPSTNYPHSHSTGSLSTVVSVIPSDYKRPPSASVVDLRSKMGCESVQITPSISLEDERLVTMMENRCRQHNRWLSNRNNWYRQLYDGIEEEEKRRGKIWYNDTGSIEEITSTSDYYQNQLPTNSDCATEESKGAQQSSAGCSDMEMETEIVIDLEDDVIEEKSVDEPLSVESRKLWALRATFEEEEEQVECEVETIVISTAEKCDDFDCPPPPQITTSTLESPTHCSFPNHCSPRPAVEIKTDEESDCCAGGPNSTGCLHLPLPTLTSETRRQSYQNLLGTRKSRQKLESKGSSERDNSFDSVETEGSSTDASRLDVVTTSMESTTDNTDSTGEGQIHKLQQMKADSGYKSLETNNGSLSSKMALGKCHQQMNAVDSDGGCSIEMKTIISDNQDVRKKSCSPNVVSGNSYFKTASKKRREYTRERQVVETSFGWQPDHEEMSCTNEPVISTTSAFSEFVVDESQDKTSVFLRFFRAGRERSYRPVSRDFSIDEKSDALYQEFSRRDPVMDPNRCRSPRMRTRHRIYQHTRHSVPNIAATADNGGVSEGDSPCSISHHHHHPHRSKVSPEDSIEEEDNQPQCDISHHRTQHCDDEESMCADETVATSPHIPVIKVAPENSF